MLECCSTNEAWLTSFPDMGAIIADAKAKELQSIQDEGSSFFLHADSLIKFKLVHLATYMSQ